MAEGWLFLLRWFHFLAVITWIGILYYFNFVQTPFFASAEPPALIVSPASVGSKNASPPTLVSAPPLPSSESAPLQPNRMS